ncbi:TPA: MbeD family mobilization/exclusion protein [Klebsiella michiganensis]|nr:MbeD family mobilization/exclusion protein [Klebsiella michiganensis]
MTELEKQLLSALEQLQQNYAQRLNDWESAFVELRQMYMLTRQENEQLSGQVIQLSQQVKTLSGQVTQLSERTEKLSRLYGTKR